MSNKKQKKVQHLHKAEKFVTTIYLRFTKTAESKDEAEENAWAKFEETWDQAERIGLTPEEFMHIKTAKLKLKK